MQMNDLVKMLRDDAKMQLSVDYDTERAAMFENKAADRIEELEAEVERLKAKCDMQATILRRLTPETHPGTFFIYGTLGDKDQNGMPEKLMVIPTYGVDFSYIYVRDEKTTGPEW
jgi:hypothetical protein